MFYSENKRKILNSRLRTLIELIGERQVVTLEEIANTWNITVNRTRQVLSIRELEAANIICYRRNEPGYYKTLLFYIGTLTSEKEQIIESKLSPKANIHIAKIKELLTEHKFLPIDILSKELDICNGSIYHTIKKINDSGILQINQKEFKINRYTKMFYFLEEYTPELKVEVYTKYNPEYLRRLERFK